MRGSGLTTGTHAAPALPLTTGTHAALAPALVHTPQDPGMLPLRHSLRNKLLQRSSSMSVSEDSLASTPLRISLSLPRHSDSSSLRASLGLPPQ